VASCVPNLQRKVVPAPSIPREHQYRGRSRREAQTRISAADEPPSISSLGQDSNFLQRIHRDRNPFSGKSHFPTSIGERTLTNSPSLEQHIGSRGPARNSTSVRNKTKARARAHCRIPYPCAAIERQELCERPYSLRDWKCWCSARKGGVVDRIEDELDRAAVLGVVELAHLYWDRWCRGNGNEGRQSWSCGHVGSCGYRCLCSGCAFLGT
jgi:hypothetical protein